MTAPVRADLIEDGAGFGAIEAEWWELWRRCPAATPFASPAWVLPWWRVFEPGRLAAVAVRSGDRLVALAPLYLEEGPLGCRLLTVGIGNTDYLDLLVDPAAAERAGPALAAAVGSIPGWQAWELEELPPGGAGLSMPVPEGCQETASDHGACPVLALTPDAAEPLDSVPARQRRKTRMARHRTARRGGTIERVTADGTEAFLDALIGLHTARWEARGEGGVLADPRVRSFHAQALPALAETGLLRATTLVIEGRVAAAYYGLSDTARAYAYLGGFDPDFAFESPGTVLLADALEQAARDGAGEFHFLRGQEGYKYGWGAVDRWNRRRSFRRTGPA